MMSFSILGFDVVSGVLICLATLGIVVGLVGFHFLLSILRVLLILSRLFRATISVFFVPCCPVYCHFIWFHLTCLNEINGDGEVSAHLSVEPEHPYEQQQSKTFGGRARSMLAR